MPNHDQNAGVPMVEPTLSVRRKNAIIELEIIILACDR